MLNRYGLGFIGLLAGAFLGWAFATNWTFKKAPKVTVNINTDGTPCTTSAGVAGTYQGGVCK